ncbi:DegT/DnrJ/EryC1/StrS family aminotransferase, partial [Patescibacteria group bacterium]|nr:DegT/DnrJ/EryC1/StrS family aminotransferase [Patescibacteria group bacterium]
GKRFTHEIVGYNYRMTNMQAALGLSGLEEIEWAIEKKRYIAKIYNEGLQSLKFLVLPQEKPYARSVFWMYALLMAKNATMTRDEFRTRLREEGVDTRDFFVPIHRQPVFTSMKLFAGETYPVTDDLSIRGFYIPSGLAMTDEQQKQVIQTIRRILR